MQRVVVRERNHLEDYERVMANHAMDLTAMKGHARCLEGMGRWEEAVEEWMKVFGETGETSVAENIARVTKRLKEETKERRGFFGSWRGGEEAKSDFKYDDRYGALKTEYEICCDKLGVKITDSLEEVKRQFHALALQCHPDKNADAEAQKRFIEIRKAYEYIVANYSTS